MLFDMLGVHDMNCIVLKCRESFKYSSVMYNHNHATNVDVFVPLHWITFDPLVICLLLKVRGVPIENYDDMYFDKFAWMPWEDL